MSRPQKMVFWCSLIGGLAGLGAFYGFGLQEMFAKGAGLGAGVVESSEASSEGEGAGEAAAESSEEGGSGSGAPGKVDASTGPSAALIFCLVVFAAIPFITAWHGSSISASGDAVAASALWGLIPAMLLALSGWGAIAMFLWAADDWSLEILKGTALPIAIVAGAAWELGFMGIMPFVPRAEGA